MPPSNRWCTGSGQPRSEAVKVRNFEAVAEKARTAFVNSDQRAEDHFVEITEMIEIGTGQQILDHTERGRTAYATRLTIADATSRREAPTMSSARTIRSSDTDGSPASILATRD